jgi:hypothetical protein
MLTVFARTVGNKELGPHCSLTDDENSERQILTSQRVRQN